MPTDKEIQEINIDKNSEEASKIFRDVIDLSYADEEEGYRRSFKTVNLLVNHIVNTAYLKWEQLTNSDPHKYYDPKNKDLIAALLNSIVFEVYNEVLKMIPEMMQNHVNSYIETNIIKE